MKFFLHKIIIAICILFLANCKKPSQPEPDIDFIQEIVLLSNTIDHTVPKPIKDSICPVCWY